MSAAVQEDPARVRLLEPGGDPEHGRLAAAARPQKREKLPLFYLQGNAVHGLDLAEPLADIPEFQKLAQQAVLLIPGSRHVQGRRRSILMAMPAIFKKKLGHDFA